MQKLYLVRHAKPIFVPALHPSRWELDPTGAGRLGRLASLDCFAGAYRIVSSTETKAYQTAQAIASIQGLPPVEQFGALGELYKATLVDNHEQVMTELFLNPDRPVLEGWESAAAALTRFRTAVDQLINESAGRDLVIASHGTVLSLYLAWLNGQATVNPLDWKAVGMPDLAVVDTATMRVIQPFGAWEATAPRMPQPAS